MSYSVWVVRKDGTQTKFCGRSDKLDLATKWANNIIVNNYVSDNWTVEVRKD